MLILTLVRYCLEEAEEKWWSTANCQVVWPSARQYGKISGRSCQESHIQFLVTRVTLIHLTLAKGGQSSCSRVVGITESRTQLVHL